MKYIIFIMLNSFERRRFPMERVQGGKGGRETRLKLTVKAVGAQRTLSIAQRRTKWQMKKKNNII